MPVHTKKRRIKKRVSQSVSKEKKKTVSAKSHFKKVYGDLPKWSIYLAGLRHREGLTQKQLSEKINVKQSNISLMERGLRAIGKNVAQRLAKVFNTDYRLFL